MNVCVEWTGARDKKGYGKRSRNNKMGYVHRQAWEDAFGPIPQGLRVLHKCDNPPCYNLDHLFLGTQGDNMRDAARKGRIRNGHKDKTHCPYGHPYDEANTYIDPKRGWRQCRRCKRARTFLANRRRRASCSSA